MTSETRLVISPWANEFKEFVACIEKSVLIVSPFITRWPLELVADAISKKSLDSINVVTSLSADGLANGSNDASALAAFCRSVNLQHVVSIPTLHAKVYSADQTRAILTSANLTANGLAHNIEFGILIQDSVLVADLDAKLNNYASLGFHVSVPQLDELASLSQKLEVGRPVRDGSTDADFNSIIDSGLDTLDEQLRVSRAAHGESTNSIFARTITYGLQQDPLTTSELHELVSATHPDLCDDRIDRVINGVSFGKRWKHMVRNAQQYLKRQGKIALRGRYWYLTGKANL